MFPFFLPIGKHRKPRPGLVFIPDISGFTEMVRSTEPATGQIITSELLSVLLRHNSLQMKVAEIEGDAVFFYRWGAAPSAAVLYRQFGLMEAAFDTKIRELETRFGRKLLLRLKAVAHYGEMAGFSVGSFRKLYGEVVVEAHRLLKNNVPADSYLLVTDELMAAAGPGDSLPQKSGTLCELYDGLRHLCFTYITPPYLQPALM